MTCKKTVRRNDGHKPHVSPKAEGIWRLQRDVLLVDVDGVVLKRRAVDFRRLRATLEVADAHPELEHRPLTPVVEGVDELHEVKQEDVVVEDIADVDVAAAVFG